MPIAIINPRPGGQTYTTEKQASRFIARGIACIDSGQLLFLDRAYHPPTCTDATFWNGSVKDPCAMKRPGEVRS